MITANKYGAKGVYWNISQRRCLSKEEVRSYRSRNKKSSNDLLYFASRFELNVYQHLIDLFGFHAVICQYPISLFPPGQCYPKGKQWRIDFAIKPNRCTKEPLMLIEAKGLPTEAFLTNLATLEALHPHLFNSLYLLFDKIIPQKNKVISNLLKARHSKAYKYAKDRILLLDEFVDQQISRQPVV